MIDRMKEIGELLKSQDNRATCDPMFCVQVCERIGPIDIDFCDGDNLMIHSHDEGYTYYPEHEEYAALKLLHDERELGREYSVGGYHEVWKTVAVCFTEDGCKKHLDQNGHNYRHYHGTKIFVECFYRNPEMSSVRNYLMALEVK